MHVSRVNTAFFELIHELQLCKPSTLKEAEGGRRYIKDGNNVNRGEVTDRMASFLQHQPEVRQSMVTMVNNLFKRHFTAHLQDNSSWSYTGQHAVHTELEIMPLSTCGSVILFHTGRLSWYYAY